MGKRLVPDRARGFGLGGSLRDRYWGGRAPRTRCVCVAQEPLPRKQDAPFGGGPRGMGKAHHRCTDGPAPTRSLPAGTVLSLGGRAHQNKRTGRNSPGQQAESASPRGPRP